MRGLGNHHVIKSTNIFAENPASSYTGGGGWEGPPSSLIQSGFADKWVVNKVKVSDSNSRAVGRGTDLGGWML